MHDRYEAETRAEALKSMIQEMNEAKEQLVAKEHNVSELTLKLQNYSAFEVPVPFSNKKIVMGPQNKNKRSSMKVFQNSCKKTTLPIQKIMILV